jgi:hypothetical protein
VTKRLRAVLLLGGAVALATALFLLVPALTGSGASSDPAEPLDRTEPEPAAGRDLRVAPTADPSSSTDVAGAPGRPTAGHTPGPDAPGEGPADSRFEATRARVEDLAKAFAALEAYAGDSDAESRALQERYQELCDRLRSQVSASGDHARFVLGLVDATEDEGLAVRLARILRSAEDEGFVAAMVDRVATGKEPIHRRTAILALESRDASVWQAPVTSAYREDVAPAVRDEAAGLLARALAERRYVTKHREVRATFVESLSSADPTERVRGLDALLGDRTADAATVESVRALTEDEDPAVRRSAKRTLRVLESRLSR